MTTDMCLRDNFVQNIRIACEKKRITQRELSRQSGVHFVTICRILSGDIPTPSVDICEKIAEAAGLNPEYCFVCRTVN